MKKMKPFRRILFCTALLLVIACGINFFSHSTAFVFDTPFLAVVSFVLACALFALWLDVLPPLRVSPQFGAVEPFRAYLLGQSRRLIASEVLFLGLLGVIFYGCCIGETSRHEPLWLFFVFLIIWLIGCLFDLWLTFIRWSRKRD